jgi:hypothetical protein
VLAAPITGSWPFTASGVRLRGGTRYRASGESAKVLPIASYARVPDQHLGDAARAQFLLLHRHDQSHEHRRRFTTDAHNRPCFGDDLVFLPVSSFL